MESIRQGSSVRERLGLRSPRELLRCANMFHEKPVEMLSNRHIVRRLLNVGETALYLGVKVDNASSSLKESHHSIHLHIQTSHSKNGYCKFLKQRPFGVLASAQ